MVATTVNKPYKYFDTPDGEDISKKLKYVLIPTAKLAFAIGTIDVMLLTYPKGAMSTLKRYAMLGWPLLASATTFVTITNGATILRGKDDLLNWFLGGFSAGSIFAIPFRRPMHGLNMGMALGLYAIMLKDIHRRGWKLFHIPNPENMTIRDYDWTITAQRPGNWATKCET